MKEKKRNMTFAELREVVRLAKAGETNLTDLTYNGSLPQQAAVEFIQLITDQTPFLGKVTRQLMTEPEAPVNIFATATHVLHNLPPLTRATTFTQGGNNGKVITTHPTRMDAALSFETLDSTLGRQAEQALVAQWLTRFGNDLVYVGCRGTEHLATTEDITKINKGWLQLIKDSKTASAGAQTIDTTDYLNDADTPVLQYPELCDAMLTLMSDDYKAAGATFIMGTTAYENFVRQMVALTKVSELSITGRFATYMGYPIEVVPAMPAGNVLFTPLRNLVYGICTDINYNRTVDHDLEGILHKYRARVGYQIAIDEACVLAYDIP